MNDLREIRGYEKFPSLALRIQAARDPNSYIPPKKRKPDPSILRIVEQEKEA